MKLGCKSSLNQKCIMAAMKTLRLSDIKQDQSGQDFSSDSLSASTAEPCKLLFSYRSKINFPSVFETSYDYTIDR